MSAREDSQVELETENAPRASRRGAATPTTRIHLHDTQPESEPLLPPPRRCPSWNSSRKRKEKVAETRALPVEAAVQETQEATEQDHGSATDDDAQQDTIDLSSDNDLDFDWHHPMKSWLKRQKKLDGVSNSTTTPSRN
jgi:hypothetical protein